MLPTLMKPAPTDHLRSLPFQPTRTLSRGNKVRFGSGSSFLMSFFGVVAVVDDADVSASANNNPWMSGGVTKKYKAISHG